MSSGLMLQSAGAVWMLTGAGICCVMITPERKGMTIQDGYI